MKRFLTAGLLLLCLMTSQVARAEEDRSAKIKAEMVENYLLWQEAYKLRDAERIISFESPDFTDVSETGEVYEKSDADKSLHFEMDMIRKVHHARVEIKKLTIESNRIVIISRRVFDADRVMLDKRISRVSITTFSRDIWVQYDNSWMLKRVEGTDWKADF